MLIFAANFVGATSSQNTYNKAMEQNNESVAPVSGAAVRRIAIAVLLLAGITGMLAAGLKPRPDHNTSPLIGRPVPPFHLPGIAHSRGETWTSARLATQGKPTVVNIWASWCVPCAAEAPELEAFWRANRDRVTVLGIAIQDQESELERFIDRFGLTFPQAFDAEGRIGIDFGILGVPETFVLDAHGRVFRRFIGAVDAQQLDQAVRESLAASGAGA